MSLSNTVKVLKRNIDDFRHHEQKEIYDLIDKVESGDFDSDDTDRLRELADRVS